MQEITGDYQERRGGERGNCAGNYGVKEVKWLLVEFSWQMEVAGKL